MVVPRFVHSGTPQYHPPEWYNHKLYVGRSTTIWTLGIVLFEMVCGDLPFQSKEEITTGRLHFPPGLSKGEQLQTHYI